MVIVGYNTTGGYWKLRNSWGTGWGESGYARVAMAADGTPGLCAMYLYGGWSPTAVPNSPPSPPSPPLPPPSPPHPSPPPPPPPRCAAYGGLDARDKTNLALLPQPVLLQSRSWCWCPTAAGCECSPPPSPFPPRPPPPLPPPRCGPWLAWLSGPCCPGTATCLAVGQLHPPHLGQNAAARSAMQPAAQPPTPRPPTSTPTAQVCSCPVPPGPD